MGHKKRKLSDLTVGDRNALLVALDAFQDNLDEDDEDLPSGLLTALGQFREKLEVVKHVSFSKVDPTDLAQLGIRVGPLFLNKEKTTSARALGLTEADNNILSMTVLQELVDLVRKHVSVITEAGCRVLINLLLLRVASTMSDENTDVNIIPEYPIAKTILAENRSFGGVVDFLMAKLPARYTDHLLRNPVISLNNPDLTPITSNIFEAKRDRVDAAIPQVALAAASHCKQHSLPVLRGCITSGEQWVFFIYEAKEVGGLVSCSSEYSIGQHFQDLPLILGILRDWVCALLIIL
ncbi:hypothetical protein PILCRDRAFT_747605 [Piloderma croceum F 1598]|uniref:Uncharacterized protein n=1 Tax=Piloderma croceum (strain F 1598) TaxID=765440 RepID=A0A0C3ADQ5_PILCF|nr:hypothetical protein PILCRDRAFT_747605 [Piloderma croceum F 1598]